MIESAEHSENSYHVRSRPVTEKYSSSEATGSRGPPAPGSGLAVRQVRAPSPVAHSLSQDRDRSACLTPILFSVPLFFTRERLRPKIANTITLHKYYYANYSV